MLKPRRRRRPLPLDLFRPVPQWPTWDSLPSAVTRRVTELLAELLHRHAVPRLLPAPRKEASNE
jgi:hypothetical protein